MTDRKQPDETALPHVRQPSGLDPWELPTNAVSRRRFMALLSASAALAAGAGCSKIDRGTIVPAARTMPEAIPGVASLYASTFQEGAESFGVLVKTREGRPIHVAGNDLDPLARGKAPLRAIADVLRLYDPDRLRGPLVDGHPAAWDAALARLARGVRAARHGGRPVVLLTGATPSPTRRALVGDLKRAVPTLEHVSWEPALSDAEQEALRSCFGATARARPRLDRARVVLSVGADPLADAAPDVVAGFAAQRRPSSPEAPLSRLWALEGQLTLTGAKADHRVCVKPSVAASVLFALVSRLHEQGLGLPAGLGSEVLASFPLDAVAASAGLPPEILDALANDLRRSPGAALVLVGPALPFEAHVAGHLLNAVVQAEGTTLEPGAADEPPLATLSQMHSLLERMAAGEIGALIAWGVNPVYAYPDEDLARRAMERTPFRATIGLHHDETAALCPLVFAESHWLESWGDFQPSADLLRLQQPTLRPLYDTRQGEEVLLALLGSLGAQTPSDYPDHLKRRWQREVHDPATLVPFERFWQAAIHDGVVRRTAPAERPRALRGAAAAEAAQRVARQEPGEGLELLLTLGPLHDGRYANNGWLQELPDPTTKLTWGNVVTVAPADAADLDIASGTVVRLSVGGKSVEAPAYVQPGQTAGVLTLALGHGRRFGSVATGVGVNAFRLSSAVGGPALLRGAALARTGASVDLPSAQPHQRMEGRDIVRSYTRDEYATHAAAFVPEEPPVTLYPPLAGAKHKWGMAIDLSACVGCSACVIACQSENNVAVVGPEQVVRGRHMQWIRIDRYYVGDDAAPRVLTQPMLCQQCDDAPCETVCPVNATTHSAEGLNQMVYNRCVGTRYCANNCPYKVRRFNFLDFTSMKKPPESLAFNPEVTVRPRGVMEKCTFCVQRIEEAREQARMAKRPLRDGDIRPACAAACPAEAIVFGDLKDPKSRVSQLAHSNRGYKVLSELGVRPVITYLAEVRNPSSDAVRQARRRGDEGGDDDA